MLKCERVEIFLKFLPRLFHAALIPHASVCNLECKKGVGRQHTTFSSCLNAVCSNEYFHLRVDYAQEGSTYHFDRAYYVIFAACFMHAERS